MARPIPGMEPRHFGALWDGDDGGGGGAGDVSGPDESNAFGTSPGIGISDPATGVSGAGPGGDAGLGDIGDAISAVEAAQMAPGPDTFGTSTPNVPGFDQPSAFTTGLLGLPEPLSFLDPTPMSLMQSLALAPLGPLGSVIGLGINAAQAFGLEGTTETADEAVSEQEASVGGAAGGDAGILPTIGSGPLSPFSAQQALAQSFGGLSPNKGGNFIDFPGGDFGLTGTAFPPGTALGGVPGQIPNFGVGGQDQGFHTTSPPPLSPELLAAFQQRLASVRGDVPGSVPPGSAPPIPPPLLPMDFLNRQRGLSPGFAFGGVPGQLPQF